MKRLGTYRETWFDPLFAGAAISRTLLDAVSRPATVLPLGDIPLVVPPSGLRPACAVLLAVLDRDVTFHVADAEAADMRDYLRFNTGAHAAAPEDADFVLVVGPTAGPALDAIVRAAHEPTDDGVRLVYVPDDLNPLDGRAEVVLELDDAEIYGTRRLTVDGLAAADFARLHTCRATSRPVDLWFVSPDGRLAAIPRTTRWRPAR
jgi:alpha-D-ribose 1-methylphosphonate 5-triphosphate synthase subunit PhnH